MSAASYSLAGLAANTPGVFLLNPKTADRSFEFFTADIRNRNMRRVYYNAVCRFAASQEGAGLRDPTAVRSLHVD